MAITIRDQGAGMDEATQTRAFEQFYRSDAARRAGARWQPGGGLYAANGLMRAMGGRARSAFRRRAEVRLHVPAEPSDEGAE